MSAEAAITVKMAPTHPDGLNTFTQDMERLINEVQPSPYQISLVASVTRDVERISQEMFPNSKVKVFGSVETKTSLKGSELDLFLETNSNLDNLKILKKFVGSHHSEINILCTVFKTKVPIIKFIHPTGWRCNLNTTNRSSMQVVGLIKFITSCNERFGQLIVFVKHWARVCRLSGSTQLFSSHALTMMVVFYLQQRDPPAVPSIKMIQTFTNFDPSTDEFVYKSKRAQFLLNIMNDKKVDVKELVTGFFSFFGEFNYENCIDPLSGRSLPKEEFLNLNKCDSKQLKLMIQEPFDLVNLAQNLNYKTIDLFIKACKTCANVIRTSSEDSMIRSLLHVEVNPEMKELQLISYLQSSDPAASPKRQFDSLVRAILLVFQHIFLSTILPGPSNREDCENLYSCTQIPIGIWRHRSQTSKRVFRSSRYLMDFNRECYISKNVPIQINSYVSFKLKIKSFNDFLLNNNRITIEITNSIIEEKGAFRDLADYLSRNLSYYVHQAEQIKT